jgi:hypothetical protein
MVLPNLRRADKRFKKLVSKVPAPISTEASSEQKYMVHDITTCKLRSILRMSKWTVGCNRNAIFSGITAENQMTAEFIRVVNSGVLVCEIGRPGSVKNYSLFCFGSARH